ncbi:MAG TPA: hypothetical protein VKB39_12020 [Candidatus Baltobacteraceae bacterium]|nr:hypothetical protein [Candidatus Baltobacteraceae bacterium]
MTARVRAPIASFAIFFAIAAIAYVTTLLTVYPRFFAPFSAFHSDMYMPVDFVARGVPVGYLIHWPRPVYWITLLAGGHLGFKGSLVFFTALLLAALALSMLVVERFAVRAPIPWWVAFAAFVFALAGPAMYFEPGLDIGYTLALLFGMLGIYAWEARAQEKPWPAFAIAGVCFLLSVLSKESFLPALVVYGIAAGVRDRRSPVAAVAIALLPLVVAVAGITETAHARFVNPTADAGNPYYMSFAPASMWALWTYYSAPLRNAYIVVLLAASLAGTWMQQRLWIGITILIAAMAMYLPYVVLPNHRMYFYECAPMPLLALLVPLALAPTFRWVQSATVVLLFVSIVLLCRENMHDPEQNFGLTQQAINRNAYKAIIAGAPQIAPAHNVLVTGLSYPYHPWIYPAFLGPLLHFTGEWTIVHEPPYAPVEGQPHARSIEARDIRLSDYDLVLAFNDKGELTKAYDPQTTAAASQTTAAATPTPVPAFSYPGGLVLPRDETVAQKRGVYPAAGGETCCFLAKSATIVLAKPAGATTAIFSFFVPDFSPFANAPERVAMTFEGIAVRPVDVPKGMHEVAVALPRSLASKASVNAFLDMTIAYVPADVGINGDTRTLSIVLTQVRYR